MSKRKSYEKIEVTKPSADAVALSTLVRLTDHHDSNIRLAAAKAILNHFETMTSLGRSYDLR